MASKSQIQKFKEAARFHKADQSERQFNKALTRIARAKQKPAVNKSRKTER